MPSTPSAHAVSQYATTSDKLTARIARIALHAYGTNPQEWFSWLGERLPLDITALEVGAGTGELWTRTAHLVRGRDLTLTDFSPVMCEHLRAVPGIAIKQCAATDLQQFHRRIRPRPRRAALHRRRRRALPVRPGHPHR